MLANNLLRTSLNKKKYLEETTTPGLWKHQCLPIQFYLIMDSFGIEYIGERHIHNLRNFRKHHYAIIEDWTGTIFG